MTWLGMEMNDGWQGEIDSVGASVGLSQTEPGVGATANGFSVAHDFRDF